MKRNSVHNPDVLSCLANLSNDEVFTPPEVVNDMLDLLPPKLFRSPDTKFLDPCTKSGVFLREIAKRLIAGLADEIPDLQERIDHIMHHQLYGVAITEMTALLARRSLYCSKDAQGKFSVSAFDTREGNIRFNPIQHTWKDGRCVYCGASRSQFDRDESLESHAYEFIHISNPKDLFNMKFDVIIGNPPYQLGFGLEGGNSANAKSIYNQFIDTSIALNPLYVVMIVPSRWMTKTAQGIPESWVDKMLQSNKFKIVHDYENEKDCFPSGVSIKGGVSYFLWNRDYNGVCEYYFHEHDHNEVVKRVGLLDDRKAGVVIRNPKHYSILDKIEKVEGKYYNGNGFSNLVSAKHFFDDSELLTSNWKGYKSSSDAKHTVKYYVNIERERTYRWISETQIPKNKEVKDLWKIYIPAAGGSGNDAQVLGRPILGEPNSVCSQTYLVIGYDSQKHNLTRQQCENIITYIETRFFRYLVSIKKKTQNGPRGVYQFVPIQDFSKPWTDEELYKKYNLTQDEIDFIESMIKPME